MIVNIPNPLTDKGVKIDIKNKVNEIMERPLRIGGIEEAIRNAVTRAAEWGMLEVFRMGWKVRENRSKK